MTKQELGSVPKSDALKMATLTPASKIPAKVIKILFTVNEFIFILYTSDQIFYTDGIELQECCQSRKY